MKIIIDTREQAPLEFEHEYITGVVRRKLDFGDYACEFEDGHVPSVYFERKSVVDLFGTTGKGYERFKREIIRAKQSGALLFLIIEDTIGSVKKGTKYSKRSGEAVVAQLMTLFTKYNLFPIYCSGRDECSMWITELYIAIGKMYSQSKEKDAKVIQHAKKDD